MGSGATDFQMTPEFLAAVAEGVGAALARPTLCHTPAEVSDADKAALSAAIAKPQSLTAGPAGEALGTALAPLAAPILARAESKFASRKLWVAVGTILPLLVQNPLGLALPPVAQVAIAGVAAIYVAAQGLVDSGKTGGSNA